MENKFIIDSFIQAAQHPPFQHHWIVETWTELVNSHFQILEAAGFNGEKLKNALKHCKWLNVIVESKGVIKDSINLYVNKKKQMIILTAFNI
jgi:hypothetical protein